MAASTDFNYEIMLSLDRAKLVKRKRLNFLGSKELILDYNLQTGAAKEEATEYLEANRLTLVDPSFGFKTYSGAWNCVEIEFNEDTKIIRQRFKIDSSLDDDVSLQSAAETVTKDYNFKTVDPSALTFPSFDDYTTLADQVYPAALDTAIWTDSGTTYAGQTVYYDAGNVYALYLSGSNYRISLIADIGGTPDNYFQSSTITDLLSEYIGYGAWTGGVIVSFNNLDMTGTSTPSLLGLTWSDSGTTINGQIVYRELTNSYSLWAKSLFGSWWQYVITSLANEGVSTVESFENSNWLTLQGHYPAHVSGTFTGSVDVDTSYISDEQFSSALNLSTWTDSGLTENGEPTYYDQTTTYAIWKTGTSGSYKISIIADVGGTPTNYMDSTTGIDGIYNGNGTFTGTLKVSSINQNGEIWSKTVGDNGDGTYDVTIGRVVPNRISGKGSVASSGLSGDITEDDSVYITGCGDDDYNTTYLYSGLDGSDLPYWTSASTLRIYYNSGWKLGTQTVDVYSLNTTYLSTGTWDLITGAVLQVGMYSEIGRSGRAFIEESLTTINDTERLFVSQGGDIDDPVSGELKTISNAPLDNGRFRSVVTTKTAISQRFPALYGAFLYSSKGVENTNAIILGRNRTQEELNSDIALIGPAASYQSELSPLLYTGATTTSISVSLNDYGRIDYTILANNKT